MQQDKESRDRFNIYLYVYVSMHMYIIHRVYIYHTSIRSYINKIAFQIMGEQTEYAISGMETNGYHFGK